jgi:uncharacterized cupredoxin-like copper-binding protein
MKRMYWMIGVLALLFAAMSACGASGPQAVEATVVMSEFSFSPSRVQAEAGAEMSLTLDNSSGTLEHNFLIMNAGINLTEEFSDGDQADVLFEQLSTPAGETTVASFTAPAEPGTYQILCSVPGHLSQGMSGTFTVVAP